MHASSPPLAALAALLAVGLVAPIPADACCPAYPKGHEVHIDDQEILIVWEPATRVERFVRRAAFRSDATKDFGFLVPTPSTPTLSEVPDRIFDALADRTRPVVQVETYYKVSLTPLLAHALAWVRGDVEEKIVTRSATSVEVLHRQRVAGFDAAVLAADDPRALLDWLAEHGYDARPELEAWVKPYITAGWKITAFKYASGPRELMTGSVCMTFESDAPLFPYRVPEDQRPPPGGGVLRVYYVGDARASGALGATRGEWAGQTRYAAEIDGIPELLAGVAPAAELPMTAWLTKFEDRTWPGGAEDLYFGRAADSSPLIPISYETRAETIPLPTDLIVVALGGIGLWFHRRRRRRADVGPVV